jgi:hypothetical protein
MPDFLTALPRIAAEDGDIPKEVLDFRLAELINNR